MRLAAFAFVVGWLLVGCSSSTSSQPTSASPTTPPETPPTTTTTTPEQPPTSQPPIGDTSVSADLEIPPDPPKAGETQAQIAYDKNREGIALVGERKYAEATMAFRSAVARVPLAAYFFNLCVSLWHEGKLDEAMRACDGVEKNEPTAQQQAKAEVMFARIRAREQRR